MFSRGGEIIHNIKVVFLGIYSIYILVWALPAVLFGAVLSLGDSKRIIFIDNVLSKDVEKLHANNNSMMSYSIISRFMRYCIIFPFIKKRAINTSIKFKIFMWINSIGWWGVISFSIYALLR
ncbi:hypothetical protein LDJ79_08035 [Vibrio tritonius]|uniref:Uncharacterized protein n=1 Tax=Vibrio tritonius TaxID=1435069 RepID=A0ABS7YMH8_9VIBR|nr:hypothetical protein [Vibrio tritonius]MCA2016056.1 hypothetical protein [Vibrio tritonius]